MAPAFSKTVLVMGVKQDNSPDQRWSTPEARESVQKELARAKEEGYDVTLYRVDTANPAEAVDEVKGLLRSKQWDGVLVGFGIRGDAGSSLIFTDLINAAISEVSPPPKLMFPLGPDKLVGVMDREFRPT